MTYGLTTLVQELRGRGDDLSVAAADKLERQAQFIEKEWRPVEEANRDEDTIHLCVRDLGGERIIDLGKIDRFWDLNGITHWMPLPELPKETNYEVLQN